MPIHHEASMLELDRVYLNGGRRGYLVSLPPALIVQLLGSTPVNCAIDKA
jgi:prolyl-tRNA editing enzyme YbaK/EbsC (Cys-tRNA(Pro) deacylase)